MIRIQKTYKGILLDLIFDEESYKLYLKFNWHISMKHSNTQYLYRTVRQGNNKPRKSLRFHRELLKCSSKLLVDHINGNGLDNRLENLRLVTPSQNTMNSKKTQKLKTSKYKGVSFCKREKKWRLQVVKNNKVVARGYFNTEIEAAKAYNKAAQELFGEYAKLNEITD